MRLQSLTVAALGIILATGSSAYSQVKQDDNDRKLLQCRGNKNSLLGLSRKQLRETCGIWARTHVSTRASGEFEQIIYGYTFHGGPFLYVYLENGIVTSVQD